METNPKKIFVGNLPYAATSSTLTKLFGRFGEIDGAKIVLDRTTNRSKGFGFVTFSTEESAQKAVESMNGTEYEDRALTVRSAALRGTGPLADFEENPLLAGMPKVKKGGKLPGWGAW